MKQVFKKCIVILLVMSMVVISFATTALAYDFTSGTITMTNLHPGAIVKGEHIIRPNTSRTTGWEFFPGLGGNGYQYNNSILKAFAEAYGISPATYGASGSQATETEAFINFEQAVLREVIEDYDKTYGNGDDPNSAAISGTANASEKFRKALSLANQYYFVNANKGFTRTADSNGKATIVTTRTNDPVALTQTGLYLIVPQGNSEYSYNPTAAYLGFQYSSGIPNAHQSVTVKAKRISNIVNKTAAAGATSLAKGDTASYTITGLYPYFADDYHNTAIYTIADSSGQLKNFTNIVVKVGSTTLTAGTDYILNTKNSAPYGFVITLIDGNGSNSVANYKSDYVGKTVTVTYTATVSSLDANGKVENTATVATQPNSSSDAWVTKSVYISDTYEYKLVKTNDYEDAQTDRYTLAGAQFTVMEGGQYVTFDTVEEGMVLYCTVKGTSNSTQTITVPRGGVVFKGLDYDKVYTVTEVKAPDGYSLTTTPLTLSASALGLTLQTTTEQGKVDNVETTTVTSKIVMAQDTTKEAAVATLTADFKNTKLFNLPETGGMGTYVLTLVGVSVMASAVIVFWNQKREEVLD